MPERGGPTAQSGLLYQNSVTALYMGRLCDATSRPDAERIIKVRVEAPEKVDDTVVTYADGHRDYIQAKENVRENHEAWKKLWQCLGAQFLKTDFQRGKDRLHLHIGELHDEHRELRELCERAGTSESYSEWVSRLTYVQQALIEKLKPLLDLELLSNTNLLAFFEHIDVEIRPLDDIERDLVPYWMPQSDKMPIALFHLLRDRVGGEARRRGSFTSDPLRKALAAEDGVQLTVPVDIDHLRASVRECGALLRQYKRTFANTGRHLPRSVVDDIVVWVQEITSEEPVAVLVDRAGMGKSVVLRDVFCALENTGIVVLAIKADQQLSGVTKHEDLRTELHLPDSVEQIVGRLAVLGPVVVLIDQIDALSLSLARDQRALNVVLDLVARLRLIPGVRILLSCRTFDLNSDPKLKRIEIGRRFSLVELSYEEVKDILQEVNVDFDTLSTPTQELLRIPLHLDLFVRALEGRTSRASNRRDMHSVTSLQELYALLWRNVICKLEPGSPPVSEREEVLQLMTKRMNREQRTSVPQSILTAPESEHLRQAANWLASESILTLGVTEWSFFHQTFFDYCYARQFVEGGGHLAGAILGSHQGLFERPQLIQVLSYLRGSNLSAYLRELQSLFSETDLRFHLRDLLLRWFGALPNPMDGEWLIARRMLVDSTMRPRVLRAMDGNPGWFARLNGRPIEDLLAQDDQTLDTQVVPYLASMVDLEATQTQVVSIVAPYIGHSEQWNNRLVWMLSQVRNWYTDEIVDLFERMFREAPQFDLNHIYRLGLIAQANPPAGCRLIRMVFDRVLENYQLKREAEMRRADGDKTTLYRLSLLSLSSELETLRNSAFDEALKAASQAEPKYFVEATLPWLEKVIQLRNEPRDDLPFYVSDDISSHWYESVFTIHHEFIWAFISALSMLAQTEPDVFRQVATHLSTLPYGTPQQLLAHVYRSLPEIYATDAFHFLVADRRRLDLGDSEQYDSRQLIKAIYPFLSDSQRAELEAFILSYSPPIHKCLGVAGLRRWGLEQLYLLQSIPIEYLTERGIHHLGELERKFPGVRAPEDPVVIKGGVVGSPISDNAARKMSDKAWLRAMRKYQGGLEHRGPLKGGARELAQILAGLIKDDPKRFYQLVGQAPDTVDDSYVRAFLKGLAESGAPAEWLFEVVRRFESQPDRDIKRTIARVLEKRIQDGLPADIMALLQSYVRGPMAEDETWWERERSDLDDGYINSDRGCSLRTLMRALDQLQSDEAKAHKWQLIEFVATDPSPVLRAGAIGELLYMLRDDRERAISLFERLMEGHSALLHSRDVWNFLYYGIYKYFARMKPFIRALMAEDNEACQQRGAELGCIAAMSPSALDSAEERISAQALAREVMTGPATWRRGAARLYSHHIADGPSSVSELKKLLNDEDVEVRRFISGAFYSLRGEHIFSLRQFIEAFAASRSLHARIHGFAQYLWEYGSLDPSWTLSVIEMILDNEYPVDESPRWVGGEELIRLVLRIYNDPAADGATCKQAMDVFDRLMERYTGQAQKVLGEWDRR
jgi:hypothetical protein